MMSGFPRDVDEICALVGYYAASNGNHLPTFQDNVSVPDLWYRYVVPKRKDYHSTLRNAPEERRSHKFSHPEDKVLSIFLQNIGKA
jgi:hypothetical protein